MWILKRIKANFMEMIKKRKRVRLFTSLNILYSKLEKSISTIENYKPIIILALVYLLITFLPLECVAFMPDIFNFSKIRFTRLFWIDYRCCIFLFWYYDGGNNPIRRFF